MAVIACTKKLFDLSNFQVLPIPEVGYRPLNSWHAHLFKVGRKNCVMIMNDLTRYQVVLYGVRKEHFKNFDNLFLKNLEIALRADQFTDQEINLFLSNMDKFIYTKTHNRSIVGSLNEQIFMTQHWIEKYLPTDELNIVGLNVKLNDSVILKLAEGYPRLALKNALLDM
ncbi:hypothetical protein HQN89_09905 [Paenibacillus frigoriresistens]|uniref:DUF6933 domain-containing protein n=1 Tax=Paenibacillus alginolyticus TaxID=59839 RepID=UPI0015663B36|nr:hypothetical protein [Paenibacillus frigoriresistens]NRF91333.1 hypothetical protein [Paenibacillus frigoriresistens]